MTAAADMTGPAFEVMGHAFRRGQVTYVGKVTGGWLSLVIAGAQVMVGQFDSVQEAEQFRTALLKELGW